MAKSFKSSIATGVFWKFVQLLIQRSFSFIIKLVLAKLLFPEDFGVVGMATVFISFITALNDMGMAAALVQRKDNILNTNHFHTAFWSGIVWSCFLYVIISVLVSPLAAKFYEMPIIESLIPVLSLGILTKPLIMVNHAQLTRALNFKKITYIENISTIFSGLLALLLAYFGFGVWSLVFNSVASIIIGVPFYFKATGWKPKFIWRKKEFNEIFGFGVYTTGTNLFNNLISKLDYLVIGKFLSASALGVYTLAFVLTDTFRSHIMRIIKNVMYPIYGQVQHDKKALKGYYLKVVLYNSILIYPIMVFFLILGEQFIELFFGAKWFDSVRPLKILSVAVMFHLMVNSNTSLIRGMGKPGLEMKIQLIKSLLIYMPLVVLGTYYYGTIGAAYAILINKIIAVFIANYYLKKLINLSSLELFNRLKGAILSSLFSGIFGYITYEYFNFNFYATGIGIFIFYISITYLFYGKELKKNIQFFAEKYKNRKHV